MKNGGGEGEKERVITENEEPFNNFKTTPQSTPRGGSPSLVPPCFRFSSPPDSRVERASLFFFTRYLRPFVHLKKGLVSTSAPTVVSPPCPENTTV